MVNYTLLKFLIRYYRTERKENFFLHLCHSYIKMLILLFKAFHQLCLTTLANLTADIRNENKSSKIFSKEDVINFIEKNWESMTTAPRRTRSTWHATVSRSMVFTTFTTLIWSFKSVISENLNRHARMFSFLKPRIQNHILDFEIQRLKRLDPTMKT